MVIHRFPGKQVASFDQLCASWMPVAGSNPGLCWLQPRLGSKV